MMDWDSDIKLLAKFYLDGKYFNLCVLFVDNMMKYFVYNTHSLVLNHFKLERLLVTYILLHGFVCVFINVFAKLVRATK